MTTCRRRCIFNRYILYNCTLIRCKRKCRRNNREHVFASSGYFVSSISLKMFSSQSKDFSIVLTYRHNTKIQRCGINYQCRSIGRIDG